MKSIHVLGVRVDDVTMVEAIERTEFFMAEPRLHHIATVNPEFVMAAGNDPDFAQVLEKTDLNLPDGANLLRVAKGQGTPLRERVAGTDFIWYFAALAGVTGWRVFLLGGRNGAGGQAAARLQARDRHLRIVGTFEGTPDARDDAGTVQRINESGATILLVAYGAPVQDVWIERNRDQLPQVRVAIGVGGAFDFIAGRVRRAPRWMQNVGLEWLFRLSIQPWRARRQWALVIFTLKMLRQGRMPPSKTTLRLESNQISEK